MAEFWLPTDFLTEEDILMDFKPKKTSEKTNSVFNFPGKKGSSSGLNSPNESITSWESEEEEYLAGLTNKMANSTLLHDLCKYENWGQYGSNISSPNCPAFAVADRKDKEWQLLQAAAAEVARMRMIEEANAYYKQLQIAKFQLLKRELLMKQQQAMAAEAHALAWAYQKPQLAQPRTSDLVNLQPRTSDLVNLSTVAWPSLKQSVQPQPQQQATAGVGSGMRAVFLGNTGPKRESVGTGVFLPRRSGGAPEPRKKSGCSTVLLPDRVVQALNLNFEAMDSQSPPNNAPALDFDAAVNLGQQRKNLLPLSVAPHADLRLPQDWSY